MLKGERADGILRNVFDTLSALSHGPTIDRSTMMHYFPLDGMLAKRLFDVMDITGTGVKRCKFV